jgi:predicted dehydrogenase/threonine dehydrogenase-like Zn-dependent dehydrogenase
MGPLKQVSQSIKDGRIQVLDVPPPALRPHGVVVRTAWSLISAGTERAKVDLGQKSLLGKARSRPDQVAQVVEKVRRDGLLQTYRTVMARLEEQSPIGYSSAGIVTAVGELAGGFNVGDRVACAGGEYANHAEIVYVPGTLCVPVPDDVGLDEAAFATVGAIALQGVRQSEAVLGDRVAVIGLGLVGQLTVQLLRAAGCEVAGMDPNSARCTLAAGFGAGTVTSDSGEAAVRSLLAATGGQGYDAVILTAATKDDGPVRLAGQIARDRGTVVIVGDVGMNVPRSPFYEKELTLKLSRSYGPGRYDPMYEELALDYPVGYVRWTEQRNMAEFIRLIAERQIDVKILITHRFAIDEAAEAYAVTTERESGSLGVLLEYPQTDQAEAGRERIWVRRPAETAVKAGGIVAGAAVAGTIVAGGMGVSLLGAGNFATATLLPALSADKRFVPRGVYTTSGLSARDVAERNGFAFCAGSEDEVLSDPETTAVIIATRHASHADLAQKALRAGKTVFVEKPLAITEDELAAVVVAQRETGGRRTGGFNRRFSPMAQTVARELLHRSSPMAVLIRVNAGSIPLTHWIQRLEEGGGRIIGEMCHFVDLAAFLVGSPAISVSAASADPGKPPVLRDTLTATLSYADGSIATLLYASIGDTSYSKERVEVFSEGKVMVIDDFRTLTITRSGRTTTERLRRSDKGHANEMRAFLDLAQGADVPTLTFADCVASMAATFKLVESLTTGLPVGVPRVAVEVPGVAEKG